SCRGGQPRPQARGERGTEIEGRDAVVEDELSHGAGDRKSTRLNSSHGSISYAVACMKKTKPAISTQTSPRPTARTHRTGRRLHPTTARTTQHQPRMRRSATTGTGRPATPACQRPDQP